MGYCERCSPGANGPPPTAEPREPADRRDASIIVALGSVRAQEDHGTIVSREHCPNGISRSGGGRFLPQPPFPHDAFAPLWLPDRLPGDGGPGARDSPCGGGLDAHAAAELVEPASAAAGTGRTPRGRRLLGAGRRRPDSGRPRPGHRRGRRFGVAAPGLGRPSGQVSRRDRRRRGPRRPCSWRPPSRGWTGLRHGVSLAAQLTAVPRLRRTAPEHRAAAPRRWLRFSRPRSARSRTRRAPPSARDRPPTGSSALTASFEQAGRAALRQQAARSRWRAGARGRRGRDRRAS